MIAKRKKYQNVLWKMKIRFQNNQNLASLHINIWNHCKQYKRADLLNYKIFIYQLNLQNHCVVFLKPLILVATFMMELNMKGKHIKFKS